jgi:hypothetical protein
MFNTGFAVAGVIAGITFLVHTFAGQIYVVRPLLAVDNLSRASRWLAFYCWHMVTILLAAMSAMYFYASVALEARPLGVMFTVLAAAFSLLCVAVALKGRVPPLRFPATSLFAAVAIAGAWGAWSA